MAIRPIRLFGDPILLTPADPVRDFDRQLRSLVKDLTETPEVRVSPHPLDSRAR
jgi:peptide deformylase